MDYKQEIISLLDKINTEQVLRYIYIIIRDIVNERGANNEG